MQISEHANSFSNYFTVQSDCRAFSANCDRFKEVKTFHFSMKKRHCLNTGLNNYDHPLEGFRLRFKGILKRKL